MRKGSKHTPEVLAKIRAIMNSPEVRIRNSITHKGKVMPLETRGKIAIANKGKHRSEECRAHNRKAQLVAQNRPEVKDKIHTTRMSRPYVVSTETRLKMSIAARHRSPETIARMSAAQKGKVCSVETREKMSAAQRILHSNPEYCFRVGAAFRGKCLSQEHREKIGVGNKGKIVSAETRAKLREANAEAWNNPEYRARMHKIFDSSGWREKHSGLNCHFWQGGKSFEPYTLAWTRQLKYHIRERDNYACQICTSLQNEKVFPVHHIDYDKKNCEDNNLITLCQKCHSKTNTRREYWMRYLQACVAQKLALGGGLYKALNR